MIRSVYFRKSELDHFLKLAQQLDYKLKFLSVYRNDDQLEKMATSWVASTAGISAERLSKIHGPCDPFIFNVDYPSYEDVRKVYRSDCLETFSIEKDEVEISFMGCNLDEPDCEGLEKMEPILRRFFRLR